MIPAFNFPRNNGITWEYEQTFKYGDNQTQQMLLGQRQVNRIDGSIVNMTSSDFQPLQDLLNEAREAIHSNNTADALDALNEADSQLSELSNSTLDDTEGSDE